MLNGILEPYNCVIPQSLSCQRRLCYVDSIFWIRVKLPPKARIFIWNKIASSGEIPVTELYGTTDSMTFLLYPLWHKEVESVKFLLMGKTNLFDIYDAI